ncbi:MAG: xanthine dehydrogenase family protein subunit M [Acidimicrobiia bacterium]|nr:xanthine dehydrogenase family protein subunit M [Acidimicrobiia bacterium]
MYPSVFDYKVAHTVEEALDLLNEHGSDARILAGGQSLIPMMKLRLAHPGVLVDINRIPGLSTITTNGHLAIGALARHADVERSSAARSFNKTLDGAAPWIADPIVRNRGTLCGSLAHCDPEGDWASVMLAVGGSVVAISKAGEREIPMTEFLVDFFTNSLQPGEMVKEARIPAYSGRGGGTYIKLERKIGDYATVGVASHLVLDDAGHISDAGIGLTSVGHHNLKATHAENIMLGEPPSDELFAEAANAAANACEPESDVRGPAEYKRDLVRVYTRRALAKALSQAAGNQE